MRRWNGWGDAQTSYPLDHHAAAYLLRRLGPGVVRPDAELSGVLATVPPSRLPGHALISTGPLDRLRHARGQSLPDWIALRSGRIGCFPDGVAYPSDDAQVGELLDFAAEHGIRLIPFGGGTSVVGHINPLPGSTPVLTVDLSRLDRLVALDEESRLATFEAGVSGPKLEARLKPHGYLLGHYPQSFEYSTLGGWLATRSSGQQSVYYGRIEDLLAGARIIGLDGPWTLPPFPASAAGPDLRQLILGSEGRLGVITEATVRVRPLPEEETFRAAFFPDWPTGLEAVRALVQAGAQVSMLRLSDAAETETTLKLAGKPALVGWAERALRWLNVGAVRCLLIYACTGSRAGVRLGQMQVNRAVRKFGGLPTGDLIGRQWRKSRFHSPYLRNTLWEKGYAVDTLETAVPWSSVRPAAGAIRAALLEGLAEWNERVLVLTHLSHVYADGASIYVTYLFRRAADPDETGARWLRLKDAASQAIVAHGGTISHQHGVGYDHRPYLSAEKGPVGLQHLRALAGSADPHGLLNPGKLLPPEENG
jgi:alkyldihydroxyacetonephosphate synthase